jgi:hypothetical protein
MPAPVTPAPVTPAPVTPAPVVTSAPVTPVAVPTAEPVEVPVPVASEAHTPATIDPRHSDAPLEVLVIDALWKLSHLHEVGLLDDAEVRALRSRLLARLSSTPQVGAGIDAGPLLHV